MPGEKVGAERASTGAGDEKGGATRPDFVRLLASVELGPISDRIAASALAHMKPEDAVRLLESTAANAHRSVDYGKAMAALCRALCYASGTELTGNRIMLLGRTAREMGCAHAQTLLALPEDRHGGDEEFTAPYDPEISQMSLGHQRSLARRADPEKLARLAAQGEVRVVRELLLNPRLTESMVVRIAAKRPVKADVLMEICRSPRWCVYRSVATAVALNPYAPESLVLRLLPQLDTCELKLLASGEGRSQEVRNAASVLCRRRATAVEPASVPVWEIGDVEPLGTADGEAFAPAGDATETEPDEDGV